MKRKFNQSINPEEQARENQQMQRARKWTERKEEEDEKNTKKKDTSKRARDTQTIYKKETRERERDYSRDRLAMTFGWFWEAFVIQHETGNITVGQTCA